MTERLFRSELIKNYMVNGKILLSKFSLSQLLCPWQLSKLIMKINYSSLELLTKPFLLVLFPLNLLSIDL